MTPVGGGRRPARARARPRLHRGEGRASRRPTPQRPRPSRGRNAADPGRASQRPRRGWTRRRSVALEKDELRALLLFGADPVRDHLTPPAGASALRPLRARLLVFEDPPPRSPTCLALQSHARRRTVTHPDGLQRVRPNVMDPGQCGGLVGPRSSPRRSATKPASIPPPRCWRRSPRTPDLFGITEQEIGGQASGGRKDPAPGCLEVCRGRPLRAGHSTRVCARPLPEKVPRRRLLLCTYPTLGEPVTELNRAALPGPSAEPRALAHGRPAGRPRGGDEAVGERKRDQPHRNGRDPRAARRGRLLPCRGQRRANANALLQRRCASVRVEKRSDPAACRPRLRRAAWVMVVKSL